MLIRFHLFLDLVYHCKMKKRLSNICRMSFFTGAYRSHLLQNLALASQRSRDFSAAYRTDLHRQHPLFLLIMPMQLLGVPKPYIVTDANPSKGDVLFSTFINSTQKSRHYVSTDDREKKYVVRFSSKTDELW